MNSLTTVAIARAAGKQYPQTTPFHPGRAFPELQRLFGQAAVDPDNHVYEAVRESLRLSGLDPARYGTADWNPFGEFICPGNRVVVKPNWVSHKSDFDDSWEQIITHGSVLRAVIDYVQLALAGRGSIALADGPMLNSNFAEICRRTGADGLPAFYASVPTAVPVELLDLRSTLFETKGDVVVRRHALPGDPRGGVRVDLGRGSRFHRHTGEGRYYGADYDTAEVNRHHQGDVHEYLLSGTAMQADVMIDVPKLKSHHKVGVTMALKGVVGLNCGRNWLPHRTQGTPEQGGDQFAASGRMQQLEAGVVRWFERASLRFPRLVSPVYRVAKAVGKRIFGKSNQTVRGGGWHGNDTLWRMVHDINRALMFADAEGALHDLPVRRRFVVIDGIVAGEGLGPVFADPLPCGVVLAGADPVAVDVIGAEFMGFDHLQIPMLARAYDAHPLPLTTSPVESIGVASNVAEWRGTLETLRAADTPRFAAPLGWIDHIERNGAHSPPAKQ